MSQLDLLTELQLYRDRVLNEYEHAQVLDRMDRQRVLSQQLHEQAMEQVAATSEITGVLGVVSQSVGAIEDNVARLAAISDRSLPAIVEHLALTAERLANLEEILASPTETAAAEFYRRGSLALASGWLEEAVSDLESAVNAYPYHAKSWFNLGIAKERQDEAGESAAAFARCARYGAKTAPELAASAVLLSAAVYRRIGQPDAAETVLRKSVPDLNRCPEIHLALGVHHGDASHLIRSLELAPELAADARVAGAPSVDNAAAQVCLNEDSPVARLRRLEEALQGLARAAEKVGLKIIIEIPPATPLRDPGVDQLLLAQVTLGLLIQRAEKVLGAVLASLDRMQQNVEHAETRVAKAEQHLAAQLDKAGRDLSQCTSKLRQQEGQARSTIAALENNLAYARQRAFIAEQTVRKAAMATEFVVDSCKVFDLYLLNRIPSNMRYPLSRFSFGGHTPSDVKEQQERESKFRRKAEVARELLKEAEKLAEPSRWPAVGPWLRACQEAESATRRAAQAKWEADQINEELSDAILHARKYSASEELLLVLPENLQRPLLDDEQRLSLYAASVRQENDALKRAAMTARMASEEAEQRARQMADQAMRAAVDISTLRAREAEKVAHQACQQAVTEHERVSKKFRQVSDMMTGSMRELSDTIRIVDSPRDRMVPFLFEDSPRSP